jgi:hypothetical protein
MQESSTHFFNLEWPSAGARVAGPVVWLRGWVVGKPGHDFIDVRVCHQGRIHLGILGLPRADLAAHFKSERPWLPAEFIIGVPLQDGLAELEIEVRDTEGQWQTLLRTSLSVAADGGASPRQEGKLMEYAEGTWTKRDPHLPFHGHLEEPAAWAEVAPGQATVFGWLLSTLGPLHGVSVTTDTLVFNHVAHGLTDDLLATQVPALPAARQARFKGKVDVPLTLFSPVLLRVYAEQADETVHLCFARRLITSAPSALPSRRAPHRLRVTEDISLPALPSGRPRRLLLCLRDLEPTDANLRALDAARQVIASGRWAVRLITATDGLMRPAFEQSGVAVQEVDPQPVFSATDEAGCQQALAKVGRPIWWRNLDAVAVFDPLCFWAITLARSQGLPVLFDCSVDQPLQLPEGASPAVQALARQAWQSATRICYGSSFAASGQSGILADRPGAVIPHWHTPNLPKPSEAAGSSRLALAPLRTVDWLARRHPAVAARWLFAENITGRPSADFRANRPQCLARGPIDMGRVALLLSPQDGEEPLRLLLDAAALGIPVVATSGPKSEEFFRPAEASLIAPFNPLALAHALLDFEANPAGYLRRAAAAQERVRAENNPAWLLPRWQALLETAAATRG